LIRDWVHENWVVEKERSGHTMGNRLSSVASGHNESHGIHGASLAKDTPSSTTEEERWDVI